MLGELIQSFTMTVSQLNDYANRLLTNDELLQGVLVTGEISNFKKYPSGHWYFSLKDEQSTVKCVMFRQYNRVIPLELADGMHVTIGGYASIYLRDGTFQLYAQTMRREGTGPLYEQFERLKNDLREKGLFEAVNKKPIPRFPRRIGVVTSRAGAVIRDIVEIAKRRNPNVDILLVLVNVQGAGASAEIARAIETLNARDDIDVIIIGRGGGSIEDLWAFNEEIVAYAVYKSRIPIISAVGHETDTTISDYVADLRAPTPSAAAELAVPLFDNWLQFVDMTAGRLRSAAEQRVRQNARHLQAQCMAISPMRLKAHILLKEEALSRHLQRLIAGIDESVANVSQRLRMAESKINAYSVQSVLDRGYAMVMDERTNAAITGTQGLNKGMNVRLVFKDGHANADVTAVFREGD